MMRRFAWDVHVRAHDVLHGLHQFPCDALQFRLCQILRVAAHPALSATKGNVHHRCLPCVQARQTAVQFSQSNLQMSLWRSLLCLWARRVTTAAHTQAMLLCLDGGKLCMLPCVHACAISPCMSDGCVYPGRACEGEGGKVYLRTSSMLTWGENLKPPLKGPLLLSCCTRYALNISISPLSRTMFSSTCISLWGVSCTFTFCISIHKATTCGRAGP
jgi:hypothetical protein